MNFQKHYILIFSCFFILAGCNDEKELPAGKEVKTGKQLFEYYCAGCHGESGAGQFLRGIPSLVKNKALKPVPLTPGEIRHKIKNNDTADSKMPSFDSLTNSQAALIANYIRSLSK